MGWIFIVIGALAVVAVGLVVIGKVTAELATQPPASFLDLDSAVAFVADELSPETASQLSYDDVAVLIGWHLDYLEVKGVASATGADDAPQGPLVAEENEGLGWVLGKIAESGREITDEQAAEVLEAEVAYLGVIGAIGSAVVPPSDPAP